VLCFGVLVVSNDWFHCDYYCCFGNALLLFVIGIHVLIVCLVDWLVAQLVCLFVYFVCLVGCLSSIGCLVYSLFCLVY